MNQHPQSPSSSTHRQRSSMLCVLNSRHTSSHSTHCTHLHLLRWNFPTLQEVCRTKCRWMIRHVKYAVFGSVGSFGSTDCFFLKWRYMMRPPFPVLCHQKETKLRRKLEVILHQAGSMTRGPVYVCVKKNVSRCYLCRTRPSKCVCVFHVAIETF